MAYIPVTWSKTMAASLDFTTFSNVIDGKTSSTLGKGPQNVNPSTLAVNPDLPLSTQEDANRAVEAARKAQASWVKVPWRERAEAIRNFAHAIEVNAEGFAKLITMEIGKPVSCLPDHRAPAKPNTNTNKPSQCGQNTKYLQA